MVEILLDAFHWQDFFVERFPANCVGPFSHLFSVPVRGIDLPNPAGVSIACRSEGDTRVEIAELESIEVGRLRSDHAFTQ